MEDSLHNDVCIVGYALNKKKLRKGGTLISSSSSSSSSQSLSPASDMVLSMASNGGVNTDGMTTVSQTLSSSSTNMSTAVSPPQVWKGGGLADLLSEKDDTDVRFIPVDFERSVDEQAKFHVIIHKLTEDIRTQDRDSNAKLQLLSEYLRKHPQTVLVDPIEAVQYVISRSTVCQMLQRIISQYTTCSDTLSNQVTTESPLSLPLPSPLNGEDSSKRQKVHPCQRSNTKVNDFPCPFSQPKFLIVEDISQIAVLFKASDMSFPVICKPLEACGTPTSHSMVVAVDLVGLCMVKTPSVIQEYKDHNSSFYKVYVIDQDVMVYQRPSLPNLQAMVRRQHASTSSHSPSLEPPVSLSDVSPSSPTNHEHNNLKSILFDSRYAYPTKASFFDGPPPPTPSPVKPLNPLYSENDSGNLASHLTDSVTIAEPYVRTRKPSAADLSAPSPTTYQEQFEAIASALRKEFGLTLFGFDCIIPSTSDEVDQPVHSAAGETGCCTYNQTIPKNIEIIDINFFPSYKEVEDFPQKLKAYLRKRAGLI